MTSRTYADPPRPDVRVPADERIRGGRSRRADVGFDMSLAPPAPGSGAPGEEVGSLTAWIAAAMERSRSDVDVMLTLDPRVHLVESADRVVADLVNVDAALPGPFELDVLLAAHACLPPLAGRGRRRRAAALAALGHSYADAVAAIAEVPLHDARTVAARLSAAAVRSGRAQPRADAVATFTHATRALVRGGRDPRLRRGRLARWFGTEALDAPRDADREFVQYRDTLSELDALALSGYRFVEACDVPTATPARDARVEQAGGRIVLLAGPSSGDVVLLEGREVTDSPGEPGLGAWRDGSDIQRVLSARSRVGVAGEAYLGWSTRPDGRQPRVWSRLRLGARAGATPLVSADPVVHASVVGTVLGLSHALTGDAYVLRGYVGKGPGFARALTAAMLGRA